MSGWRVCALGLVVLVGLIVLEGSHANGTPAERVVKVSNRSFDHVFQQLKWRFGGHGMTIVSSIDFQRILKQLKPDASRSVVVEILRRPWVKTVLEHDPAAGLAIPLRVYVYERVDGKTVVSYYRPSILFHSDNEGLEAFGKELDEKLEAVTQAAIR